MDRAIFARANSRAVTISRVLLADDQRDILEALQLLLRARFQVQSVSSPAAVLAAIDEADFDR
jgi:PleD family two-component response regulator